MKTDGTQCYHLHFGTPLRLSSHHSSPLTLILEDKLSAIADAFGYSMLRWIGR